MIVLGVGLLKPNISAIVAQLYPEGGSRRDAGFSIFYMGINLGAFLGSFFVPIAAAAFGWSAGFALPALGMLFGLVQFQVTKHYLGDVRRRAARQAGELVADHRLHGHRRGGRGARAHRRARAQPGAHLEVVANWTMIALAAGYFAYLLFFAGLELDERKRVVAMIALFAACAMFWAGFEQTGASFNLFADRHTDRDDLRLGHAGRRAAGA